MAKRKIETVEEYLARGGKITVLPQSEKPVKPEVVRKTVAGEPAVIMTYEDADLFYGEARKGVKPKKSKPSLKIDLDALPEALRTKFISRLKEEAGGEDYEESFEEDSDE